jgi:hypothetical protein
MTLTQSSLVALALCLSFHSLPAAAQCPPPGRIVVVPFAASQVPLPAVGGSVLSSPNILANPVHGELVASLGGLSYVPSHSFWTLGTDQLVLTRFDPQAGTVVETLHFVSGTGELGASLLDVEQNLNSLPSPWSRSDATFALSSQASAALNGSYGLEIQLAGNSTAPAFLRHLRDAPSSLNAAGGDEGGNGEQGSGAGAGWKPPRPPSGFEGTNTSLPASETILLSLRDPQSATAFAQVRQRTGASGVALRLELAGEDPATSRWSPLSLVPHQILLRAWPGPASMSAGAALYVDGELITLRRATVPPGSVAVPREARFGAEGTLGSLPILALDRLRSHPMSDGSKSFCLRSDGFDGANLSAWTLTASAAARFVPGFVGPGSLAIDLVGTHELGTMLKSPESLELLQAGRVGVRFQLNPGPLVLSSSAVVTLVDGKLGPTQSAFRVKLEQVGTSRQLRLEGRAQGSGTLLSVTAPLPPGMPLLELDWQRSPSTVEGTGYVRLYANGGKVAQIPLLANDTHSLAVVQIGALAPGGSGSGSLELDRVEIWAEPQ